MVARHAGERYTTGPSSRPVESLHRLRRALPPMTRPKPDANRIPDDLFDQLLVSYEKPENLTGESGVSKQLTVRLLELGMEAEMTEHLGYERRAPEGCGMPNSRNGKFELQLVKARQTRFTGFDEKILALDA